MANVNYHIRSGKPRWWKGNPLAAGCVAAWSWPNGNGIDSVGGLNLNPTSTATNSNCVASSLDGALGLITNNSSKSSGYYAPCPVGLQLTGDLTIVWQGTQLYTTPSNGTNLQYANIFGVMPNNTGAGPYESYMLGINSGGANYFFQIDPSGSYQSTSTSGGTNLVSINTSVWLAGTNSYSAHTAFCYINSPVSAGTINYSTSHNISYGGSVPSIMFGDIGFTSAGARNPGVAHDYGLIYNRILSTNELAWLYGKGRDLFCKPHGIIGWTSVLDVGNVPPHGITTSGSTVSGVGISIFSSVGSVTSGSTVSGSGSSISIFPSVGSVTSNSVISIVDVSLFLSIGSVTSNSVVLATYSSVASVTSNSTVLATSNSLYAENITSNSIVLAASAAIVPSIGTLQSNSIVLANGLYNLSGTGSIVSSSTVLGTNFSWTHIQGNSSRNGNTCVFINPVIAGDLIICCIAGYGTPDSPFFIYDNVNGSSSHYVLLSTLENNNYFIAIYGFYSTAAGTPGVTFSYQGGISQLSMSVDEYSYGKGAIILDSQATNSGTIAPVQLVSPLSITSIDLVIAAICQDQATTYSSSNLTLSETVPWADNSYQGLGVGYATNVISPINPSITPGSGLAHWALAAVALFITDIATVTSSTIVSGVPYLNTNIISNSIVTASPPPAGYIISSSNVLGIFASRGIVTSSTIVSGVPYLNTNIVSNSVVHGAGHIETINIVSLTDTLSFIQTESHYRNIVLADHLTFTDTYLKSTIRHVNLTDLVNFTDTQHISGSFNLKLTDTLDFTAGNGYTISTTTPSLPIRIDTYTIPEGSTTATFQLFTQGGIGPRIITISTSPNLTIIYQ